MTPLFRPLILALALVAALGPLSAPAQDLFGAGPSEEAAAPEDDFGRLTPRSAVDNLLQAFADDDPQAVRPYLDLSEIPLARRNIEGRRLAIRLQSVLDRQAVLIPSIRLSNDPEGARGDALPPDQDTFAELLLDEQMRPLTLKRGVDGGQDEDGLLVWRVSPDTLQVIAQLDVETDTALYARFIPEAWREFRVFGAPAGAWIAAIVVGALAVTLTGVLVWAIYGALSLVIGPLRYGAAGRLLRPMRVPVAVMFSAPMALGLSVVAGIPVVVRASLAPVVETMVWLAITWMVLRLVSAIGKELLESMARKERLGAVSVIALGRRAATALVIIVAAGLIASSFGLNLAGWFAALGIGGLAIALGAQKTVEHMVGGVSIIADQPIRVGDFCRVDGLYGTVEDIGLRSTRLRTLDRTLVTIPNGDLSSARIDNFASRDRFLWNAVIGLRYETTPDQMRKILRQLEILLLAEDRIAEDPRARFVGFGDSSLNIEIFAYILARDYPLSLAIREELNLQVMDIVAQGGSGFAFPSRTLYMAQDEGIAGPNTDTDGDTGTSNCGDTGSDTGSDPGASADATPDADRGST